MQEKGNAVTVPSASLQKTYMSLM